MVRAPTQVCDADPEAQPGSASSFRMGADHAIVKGPAAEGPGLEKAACCLHAWASLAGNIMRQMLQCGAAILTVCEDFPCVESAAQQGGRPSAEGRPNCSDTI